MAISSTFSFPSPDGTGLVGDWYLAGSSRGVALIVHGYAEHAGRYAEVAGQLCDEQLDVLAFDVRGHGRSAGRRGHCREFKEFIGDYDAAYEQALRRAEGKPVIVVGHSHGSLIVLRALCRGDKPLPKAAIVSSPFLGLKLQISPFTRVAGEIASRVWPSLAFPNKLVVEDLTTDPAKQDERRRDQFCNTVATARWFTEATRAQAETLAMAEQITTPTCWLVAGDDPIADAAAARRVQRSLKAQSEFHELAGFRHEVFNEAQRSVPFALMRKFIKHQLT